MNSEQDLSLMSLHVGSALQTLNPDHDHVMDSCKASFLQYICLQTVE